MKKLRQLFKMESTDQKKREFKVLLAIRFGEQISAHRTISVFTKSEAEAIIRVNELKSPAEEILSMRDLSQ